MEYQPIAYIHNDFPTKFGLPRQSGLSEHLISPTLFAGSKNLSISG